jgi:hypothetical protein
VSFIKSSAAHFNKFLFLGIAKFINPQFKIIVSFGTEIVEIEYFVCSVYHISDER